MIKDLTKDEMLWRYENLMKYITDEVSEDDINLQPEDKDVNYISDLISGSLVYLQKAGAIHIILHNEAGVDGAMFTASREECINTSWIEPEEDEITYGSRPNNKEIPVPILFDEKGNEKYTHISLVFDFPDSNIGRLCKRMTSYLRNSCKEDVNVINSVVFLRYCVTEEFYTGCLRRVMLFAFIDDHWTNSLQIPSEVEDIIEMVMDDPAKDLYDPFMRTGTNLFYAHGKYHAQSTNKYYMYATMLWAGVMGLDTEHIEYADCVCNWDASDCDFIMVTPEFGKEVPTSEGEMESISSFSLEKVLGSMNVENRSALLLLPASALTSNGKMAKLRHDITEANLLDTVVLLPANVFNKTIIAATIIYLKTGRKQDDPITFIDFSSFVLDKDLQDDLRDEEKDTIDINQVNDAIDKNDKRYINTVFVPDVREREYEWYTPNYMDDVKQVPAGYRKLLLSELLEPSEEEGTVLFSGVIVREEYLVSNPFVEYEQNPKLGKRLLSLINHEDKEDEAAAEDADNYDVYKGSPFVVQYGEKELKTYYQEFHSNFDLFRNVSVPKSCCAYRINTDLIDVNYLRLLLAQIDKESNGELRRNGIKRWSGGKGINPTILIPLSLEEQRRIYEDAKLNAAVEKARKEVETVMKEEGEAACLDVGVHGIHPELVRLLGKMKYRTSYGQNMLKHSVEVAQLCGLLAAEMGLDVRVAKRAGLLHDIGKSVDHEMEGSHVQLGTELCRKYKESATVINAVEAHHGDVEPTSLIACIVQAADAISAARPGARRETLETYTTRLKQLEDIANNYKGVDKSFAIQAGREIRVMVVPEQVTDDDMVLMARDISKQIEDELEYPGQIKVSVIRESRVVDYAK